MIKCTARDLSWVKDEKFKINVAKIMQHNEAEEWSHNSLTLNYATLEKPSFRSKINA